MLRNRISLSLITALSLSTVMGCAHKNESAAAPEPAKPAAAAPAKPAAAAPAAPAAVPIPKNHPFAKIHEGMTEAEVQKVLGDPTGRHEYPTGKNWIPFYYGSDTWRSEWLYKGKGSVVFTHGRFGGTSTVVEVLYNPATQ
jgi:hypothetical protein